MENPIDFFQFIQLLQSLENSDAAIRLRMTGEPWLNFSTVILLSEHAMILNTDGRRNLITNLRNIVEFEIEKPIREFAADCVYSIVY